MPKLREVQKYVQEVDFVPILAYDCIDIRKNMIHDEDLRLIHNCRYAIFEETDPAGELMELERAAREYKTFVFVVYEVREAFQREPPPKLTNMVKTLGIPMLGYSTFSELKLITRMIFPTIEEDPLRVWSNLLQFVWYSEISKNSLFRSLHHFIELAEELKLPQPEGHQKLMKDIQRIQRVMKSYIRKRMLEHPRIPLDHLVARNFSAMRKEISYIPEEGKTRRIRARIVNIKPHPRKLSFGKLHCVQVTVEVSCPKCRDRKSAIVHTYTVGRRDKRTSCIFVRCPNEHRFVLYKGLEFMLDKPSR